MTDIEETKEQLLEKLKYHTAVGSADHEQIKTARRAAKKRRD